MEHTPFRNFDNVITRIKASLSPVGELKTLGTIPGDDKDYPLLQVTLGKGNPHRILISGGIHGDEPAGVETICTFLENKLYKNFISDWEFTLLPCINPSGFEAGTRNNRDDIDLNRMFRETKVPQEVEFVKSVLEQPYDLDLELHEDVDSPGYYLYQKDQGPVLSSLGRDILNGVATVHPINPSKEIEGIEADQGLLSRLSEPEEMEWWPMAIYAFKQGCSYVFTLETSPALPMDIRIKGHLKAIQTALENVQEKKN